MKKLLFLIAYFYCLPAFSQENKIPIYYETKLYQYFETASQIDYHYNSELPKTEITQQLSQTLFKYVTLYDSLQLYDIPRNANTRQFGGFSDITEEWVGDNLIYYPKANHLKVKGDSIFLNDTFAIASHGKSFSLPSIESKKHSMKSAFTETWEFDKYSGSFTKEVKQVGLSTDTDFPMFLLNSNPYKNEVINLNKGTDSTYAFSDENVFLGNVSYLVEFDNSEYARKCRESEFNQENSTYYQTIVPAQRRKLVQDIFEYVRMEYEKGNPVAYSFHDSITLLSWDDIINSSAIGLSYKKDSTPYYYIFQNIEEFMAIEFHESWYFDMKTFAMKKMVHKIDLYRTLMRGGKSSAFQIKLNGEINEKRSPYSYPNTRMLHASLYTDGRYIRTSEGKPVVNEVFSMIGSFENEILEVGVFSGIYDTVFLFNEIDGSEEVHKIIPINYTGYLNANGKYLLKPEYLIHFNWEFKEYKWQEVVKKGKHGILNKKIEFIIPCKYDDFHGIHNNYIIAQKNGKWGLIDSTNKTILKFKYQELNIHGEALLAKRNNLWGYITFEGNSIISCSYSNLRTQFYSTSLIAKKNGKWGMISLNEEVQIPFAYDSIIVFEPNYYRALQNGKWGIVDTAGKEILPIIYEDIYKNHRFSSTFIFLKKDGKYDVLSENFETILSHKYDSIICTNDSNFIVMRDGRFGVVSHNDSIVIPLLYDKINNHAQRTWF